jgi:arsenic resistance protein ArsH
MRMFTIPNQSSIPKAYTQYTSEGGDDVDRLMSSGNRDRLVDCMEEYVKYTIVMKPHFTLFEDRFSERQERRKKDVDAKERQAVIDWKQDSPEGLQKMGQVNGVQVDKI